MYDNYLIILAVAVAGFMLWRRFGSELSQPTKPRVEAPVSASASRPEPSRSPIAATARNQAERVFDQRLIEDLSEGWVEAQEEWLDTTRERRRKKSGAKPPPNG